MKDGFYFIDADPNLFDCILRFVGEFSLSFTKKQKDTMTHDILLSLKKQDISKSNDSRNGWKTSDILTHFRFCIPPHSSKEI